MRSVTITASYRFVGRLDMVSVLKLPVTNSRRDQNELYITPVRDTYIIGCIHSPTHGYDMNSLADNYW